MDTLYRLTWRLCLFPSWDPNLTDFCMGILPAPVFKIWTVAVKQGVPHSGSMQGTKNKLSKSVHQDQRGMKVSFTVSTKFNAK